MVEDRSAPTASGPFSLPAPNIALLAPGTSVGGRYRIDGVLGSGGYAVVYLAFDRELGKAVALKILRPERASDEGLARFRREVAVARDISSPRLVRVFDIGSSENAIYLTMELIEGESLKERLRRAPLSVEQTIAVSTAILEGLDALHSAGVIHRDVKPGNVLLGDGGEVKLADFGLARSELDGSGVTHSGSLLGTSEYVAPEQALGRAVDARSDLYSLGTAMFEMLTGRLPFPAESQLGVLLERLRKPAPNPRAHDRRIPRWLGRVVLRLLERVPDERYASAHEVLDDLSRRHAGIRIRPAAAALTATTLVLLGLAGFVAKERFDGAGFSHLSTLSGGGIAAVSRNGTTLWSAPGVDPETATRYALARIEKRGPELIAVVMRDSSDWEPERGHTLSFLDPRTGKNVKRVALPRGDLTFPEASIHFGLDQIDAVDLDGDGIDEIVGTYVNYVGIDSYTFLYEPRIERARLLFRGSGHHRLATAADVDGDGVRELVLIGINNLLGWYNAAAAIRLIPEVNRLGPPVQTGSPDLITGAADEERLLWYALLPRHALNLRQDAQFDPETSLLRFALPGGSEYVLSADGFQAPFGRAVAGARADARRDAYAKLREAARSEAAGAIRAALEAVEGAAERAAGAGDETLIEAVRRQRAGLLIQSGAVEQGETAFEELVASSPGRPEIAFQAGEAHHVVGRLEDATRWYRRGLSMSDDPADGKPKFAYLEGMTLALAEQKRWSEALEMASAYFGAYGGASDWPGIYRDFIYWRMGQRSGFEAVRAHPFIEAVRYWSLEFRNADGEDPAALLPLLEPQFWSAPMRPLVGSLRAEVLFRSGRASEAVLEARRARRVTLEVSRRSPFVRAHLELVAGRVRTLEAAVGRDAVDEAPPGPFSLTSEAPVCDKQPPAGPAVQLLWTPSAGATSYDVHREGAVTGDRAELTETRYYNSVGLVAGRTYTFFIRARNAGAATDSNTITVAVPAEICGKR